MSRGKLAKRILTIALCAVLAAPMAGRGLTAQATGAQGEAGKTEGQETPAATDKSTTTADDTYKNKQMKTIDQYYTIVKAKIKTAGNEAAAEAAIASTKSTIKDNELTQEMVDLAVTDVKATLDTLCTKTEDTDNTDNTDTTPKTTNSNIMVGGNWVTPVAVGGKYVNVVLPVVNMGRTMVRNAVVTPQISSDPSSWPFEIETSGYSQTIADLPGTDNGGSDMDRRRELTWTLKTRTDAPSGYMPLKFDVTYEDENKTLTTATLTTYVKVTGTSGVSADGTASTPRVIVTGFSTSPETVNAGDTFTLTLHMQNTSKTTAVKNMLFDIQAASESSDTTYVAAAFLPTSGSSSIYVDSIAAGATKDISMEMEARADLSQKPYVVNVNMTYEDNNVNSYTNTASVSIPVRQEAKTEISSVDVSPSSIEVGSEANIMFSIYNTGKTTLYNTTVKFVADSVSGGDTFLGNIAPGATGSVDAYVTGAAATMDDGTVTIQITFEDESGEKTVVEQTCELYVSEAYYDDGTMDDMTWEDTETTGGFKVWYVLLPLLVVIVAVAAFFVIRKKKKAKALHAEELAALEEDELDELEDVDDLSADEEAYSDSNEDEKE